jgi:RimJ/RimL family protein N-acetyltransferase
MSDAPVTATLRDGQVLVIRAVRPDDRERIAAAVRGLEAQSIYTRLFSARKELSESGLDRIMRVEPGREELLVATVGPDERIVGSARFVANAGTPAASAEVAFVVEEDFQGLGIAGRLFEHLAQRARRQGIRAFTAEVLPGNQAMLAVFKRSRLPLEQRREDGVVHLTLALGDG